MAKTETKEFFEGTELAIKEAQNELVVSSIGTMEQLEALENTYKDVTVKDVKDLAGYNFIVDGYKDVKKIRVQVEKRRKEITKPALDFQREVKSVADSITERVVLIENHLLEQKKAFEDAEKAEKKRIFQERTATLIKYGWELVSGNYVCGAVHLSPEQITEMDEDSLKFNIELGKKELARKEAEQKRIQEEKQALIDERNKLALEREQMIAEMDAQKESMRIEREELKAQKEALDKAYPDKTNSDVKEETKKEETKKEEVKTLTETTEPVKVSHEYANGFEQFRTDILKFLNDPNNKPTRKTLVEWITNNQIK